MKVFLLYDFGDLVGIYATPEAAEPAAQECRESSIWAVGHDRGVEIIEYEVSE